MTQGDNPIRPPSRSLTMEMDDEEFDGEDAFEIIDPSDLDDTINLGSSGDESDGEEERKMSCIPSTDHASVVFSQHQSAVFCIGVNPADDKIVITGGQDDKIFVWSTATGEVIFESLIFSDSVSHAGFNHDGKYMSAVDMGGKIVVWRNNGPSFPVVWEEKIGDIQWMKWHPQANVLLVGEVIGAIYMWKIPSGECKVFGGYSTSLSDIGAFMPDGKRAISTYFDGSIRIHNLQNSSTMKYEPSETNQDNFISLDVHPDNNLVALGSLSSRLTIIKTQGTKFIQQFTCVEESEKGSEDSGDVSPTSVECVAFSRNLPYNVVLAATDNGLHVIDYVKADLRGFIPIEDGVTKLVWPEGSHLAYVGTKVGNVIVCDVRALKKLMTLEGHTMSILDITLTSGGKTLLTASDDNTVRVFQLNELFSKEDFNPFPDSG